MRTTLELQDKLMTRLKEYAGKSGLTIKDVVSEAINIYLSQKSEVKKIQFSLKDSSVDGKGLNPEFQGKGWESIRDAAYNETKIK